MNKVLKVFRYQFNEALVAIAIFYLSLLFVTVFLSMFDGSSSGFEFASAIFVFVVGLNSFKSSFRFLQFLGVTRRTFFAGSLLALVTVAAGMTLVDILIGKLFAQLYPYTTLFAEAYGQGNLLAQFVWETVLLTMFAYIGFFITILYYRCSRILKIVISLSPVYVSILLNLVQPPMEQITRILAFLGGFRMGAGVWGNILGMLVTVAAATGLCFLLIRRAPIKG